MKLKKAAIVTLWLHVLAANGGAGAAEQFSQDLSRPVSIAKRDKAASSAPAPDKAKRAKSENAEKSDKGEKSEKSDKGDKVEKSEAANATAESREKLAEKVLDPSRFFGQAMIGYAAAKNAPEVMAKLFCYCGCDITDSHISLLDCFTSIHGVDCHICQEEAVLALKMTRDSKTVSDIQKAVDETYSHNYPFETDSPTYKKYKATKLYGPKGKDDVKPAKDVKFGEGVAGPEAPGEKWAPKLKPGKQMNSQCCSPDKAEKKDSK
ncbi:MAG: PCYCGC domain-containing protein [Candidatus Obscuribacterales bacterium]|nr:PCYCGC domain-containing protein [Candidatus Obscuribacterales bacterium]